MTDDKKREMSNSFLRQRRNLLGISILIPIYLLSDVKLEKINIIGNSFTVENPSIFTYLIITIFFYFLLRYWQYFNEEKEIQTEKYNFSRKLDSIKKTFVINKTAQQINNHDESLISIGAYSHGYFELKDLKIHKTGILSRKVEVPFYLREINVSYPKEKNDLISKTQLNLETDSRIRKFEKINNSEYKFEIDIIYNTIWIFILKLKKSFSYMLSSPVFSDYYLPFLIALFPLISIFFWLIDK